MNTYIIPICADGNCYIEKIVAKNLQAAEEKFMKDIINNYDLEVSATWDDFLIDVYDNTNLCVGDLYDISEL